MQIPPIQLSCQEHFRIRIPSQLTISDATVFISDDTGNKSYLKSKGNGIYKTDSIEFKGTIGKTYILHILTHDGEEFESDPCLMQSVPDIDSFILPKIRRLSNNGTQSQDGISIYLDSKEGDNNQYYRWAYEETWKFKVPYPKKFDFNVADCTIVPVAIIKEFCWKSKKSDEILIHSIYDGELTQIKRNQSYLLHLISPTDCCFNTAFL